MLSLSDIRFIRKELEIEDEKQNPKSSVFEQLAAKLQNLPENKANTPILPKSMVKTKMKDFEKNLMYFKPDKSKTRKYNIIIPGTFLTFEKDALKNNRFNIAILNKGIMMDLFNYEHNFGLDAFYDYLRKSYDVGHLPWLRYNYPFVNNKNIDHQGISLVVKNGNLLINRLLFSLGHTYEFCYTYPFGELISVGLINNDYKLKLSSIYKQSQIQEITPGDIYLPINKIDQDDAVKIKLTQDTFNWKLIDQLDSITECKFKLQDKLKVGTVSLKDLKKLYTQITNQPKWDRDELIDENTQNLITKLENYVYKNQINTKDWLKVGTEENGGFSNEIAIHSTVEAEKAARKLRFGEFDSSIDTFLPSNNLESLRLVFKLMSEFNKQLKEFKNKVNLPQKLQASLSEFPIINKKRFIGMSNLVGGEAGERLVNNRIEVTAQKIHDITLPYNYGNKHIKSNNQIDNIFISTTGIYCVEVKSRSDNSNYLSQKNDNKVNQKSLFFNIKSLISTEIEDQMAMHTDAIAQLIKNSDDPNIKSIKYFPNDLIHTVLIVVNRNGKPDNVKFFNQSLLKDEYTNVHVKNLKGLNAMLINGFKDDRPIRLTEKQIHALEKLLIINNKHNTRKYQENILFFNDNYSKSQGKYTLDWKDAYKAFNELSNLTILLEKLNQQIPFKFEISSDKLAIKQLKGIIDSVEMLRNKAIKYSEDHLNNNYNFIIDDAYSITNEDSGLLENPQEMFQLLNNIDEKTKADLFARFSNK